MGGVDVIAKLRTLNDHLAELTDDHRAFVAEMLNRHDTGERLLLPDILQIVEMAVPGEAPPLDPIWKNGTVSALREHLDEVIWRYMPLEGLFSLLLTRRLHFSPLSQMDDTSEGTLPTRALEQAKAQLPQRIVDGSDGIDADLLMAHLVEQRRTDACISCWFMNAVDHLYMWKKYAPRNGVAIRSTVRQLYSSLQQSNDTNIHMVPVEYFGPDEQEKYTDQAYYGSLFIKDGRYRKEKELRALAYLANPGTGVDIPTEIDALIGRVTLSPYLPDWAVPGITQSIRSFGFAGLIDKSSLRPNRRRRS